ncbi:hypothetical protein [Kitasatospora sp. MMS16-BH015]|uniref:hypothetical protein n=1 Tax=Kitasatospora sp. MMS16-BH015 TaxID=2018025 RepID=UPI000CF1EBAD|nr:hypothetical protein [Kitasatospora sp. MMS16-BH015]
MPDRDTAETAMEELSARRPDLGEVELVRDSLAGEDDAEDAQWLVVLEAPEEGGWTTEQLADLDAFTAEHDGWREED